MLAVRSHPPACRTRGAPIPAVRSRPPAHQTAECCLRGDRRRIRSALRILWEYSLGVPSQLAERPSCMAHKQTSHPHSPDDFDVAVLAVRPELLRFFRRRSVEDADDLASQTVLDLLTAKRRFLGNSSLRTYAFRIAHRVLERRAIQRLRQPTRSAENGPPAAFDPKQTMPDSGPTLFAAHEQRVLEESLHKLDPHHREVLALAYGANRTQREISDQLSLPAGSVSRHIQRALDALRNLVVQVARQQSQQRDRSAIDREGLDALVDRCERYVQAQLVTSSMPSERSSSRPD